MTEENVKPGEGAFPWSGAEGEAMPGGPPPEGKPAAMPLLQRIVGVIVEPGKTMQEVTDRPAWLALWIVLVVVGLASGVVFWFRFDFTAAMEKQLEAIPNLPPEALEAATAPWRILMTKILMCVVSPIVGTVLVVLIVAVVLWGLSRLVSGRSEFVQHVAAVLHAWIPAALKGVVLTILLLARGGAGRGFEDLQWGLPTNLAFFFPDANPFVRTALSIPDLFSAWMLFLLVLGVAAAARIGKGKASAIVLSPWVLVKLVQLGGAYLQYLSIRKMQGE